MKKYFFYLSMALVALVVASCGLKGNHTSSGRPYELLVVVDAGVWDRAAGRALHDVLDSDMPGLPQSEPSFRIMYTSPKDYDSTLKLIRNIIIVDIKDIYTKGTFKYAKDVYASPQLILTIQAPDEEVFEKFVEENKQTIIDFFTRAEMNRQITLLEEKHSNFISQKIDSLFGCDIWIPSELNNSKTGEDFFWASLPAHSLMLTLQTGQSVLTLPATHFSVQLQTGASVCPSSIRAVKSASSTWLRKWTVFSPSSARSMMM